MQSVDLPVLSSGERIVWQGAPKPGIWFEPADAFAIPFSLLWLGMILLMGTAVLTGHEGPVDPMAFFIFPLFLLFGLHFTVGRFLLARQVRGRTQYYLTEKRAIIREGVFRRQERSVNLAATGEVRLSGTRGGFGTIEFGSSNPFYRLMPRSWMVGQSSAMAPAFEKVAEAERVYRMIIDRQDTLRSI